MTFWELVGAVALGVVAGVFALVLLLVALRAAGNAFWAFFRWAERRVFLAEEARRFKRER